MIETIPFLTEIDSRAEVKGSRDPLGLAAGTAKSLKSCVRALGFGDRVFLFDPARHEVVYVMNTFPMVRRHDEGERGGYRTKLVILDLYDQVAASRGIGDKH